MALIIQSNSLFTRRYLIIKKDRVIFRESTFAGGKRTFQFREIECVLLAPDNKLSFQVGHEIFGFNYNPKKTKHQKVLEAFLEGIRQTI